MYKIEQFGNVRQGQLVMDNDKFLSNLSILSDGEYVLTLERLRTDRTPEEWQMEFGKKLTDFCNEMGYDRKYREQVIRPMIYKAILPDIYMQAEHIEISVEEITSLTTKILTAAGWRAFMDALRLWMWSNGNYLI